MRLSVILPTYNESENICALIEKIEESIPEKWAHEIIVIDDNSPDKTYEIVKRKFVQNNCVKCILRTTERGLANSIGEGVKAATGSHIIVMDTDFTHDPSEIPKMLHIAELYDIVSGSRFCAGGMTDSLFHYMASLVFNWFIRVVLRTQIQDNLGGFFVIKKEKLDLLPFHAIFFGYGDYFFRLLNYSQRVGMSIIEIPTNYENRKKGVSKSRFTRLLFFYTFQVIKHRLKLYIQR